MTGLKSLYGFIVSLCLSAVFFLGTSYSANLLTGYTVDVGYLYGSDILYAYDLNIGYSPGPGKIRKSLGFELLNTTGLVNREYFYGYGGGKVIRFNNEGGMLGRWRYFFCDTVNDGSTGVCDNDTDVDYYSVASGNQNQMLESDLPYIDVEYTGTGFIYYQPDDPADPVSTGGILENLVCNNLANYVTEIGYYMDKCMNNNVDPYYGGYANDITGFNLAGNALLGDWASVRDFDLLAGSGLSFNCDFWVLLFQEVYENYGSDNAAVVAYNVNKIMLGGQFNSQTIDREFFCRDNQIFTGSVWTGIYYTGSWKDFVDTGSNIVEGSAFSSIPIYSCFSAASLTSFSAAGDSLKCALNAVIPDITKIKFSWMPEPVSCDASDGDGTFGNLMLWLFLTVFCWKLFRFLLVSSS